MRSALVLGVNGQDGSYLAERLLERGYTVIGVGRQAESRYAKAGDRFRYESLDLEDVAALENLLVRVDPDLAFHVAAVHGAAGFQYEPVWRQMMTVNVLTLHAILEHARLRRRDLRIVYASSAKVFPGPLSGVIDETTPQRPTCLYSIGKIAALNLIGQYRDGHGIAASNLFLFNHESARRAPGYFVPTIVRCLAAARHDQSSSTTLQNLNFYADWSAAAELMDIAIDIAEQAPDQDFVLASGTTWHARQAVDALFRRHGLDYRRHIHELNVARDAGPEFRVSLERLNAAIRRRPKQDFFAIVDDMLMRTEQTASTCESNIVTSKLGRT
jgi:GDPmannose 4,6-dehydratase